MYDQIEEILNSGKVVDNDLRLFTCHCAIRELERAPNLNQVALKVAKRAECHARGEISDEDLLKDYTEAGYPVYAWQDWVNNVPPVKYARFWLGESEDFPAELTIQLAELQEMLKLRSNGG